MDLNCDFNKMLLKFFTFENEFFPVNTSNYRETYRPN